jgi:hypothetical protein
MRKKGSPRIDVNSRPTPIFLFSLPRSGSTLCQRILSSHAEIATVNEPHLLLYFLFSLKDKGVYSIYNHKAVSCAIQAFCRRLPGGRSAYLSELREFVRGLYGLAAGDEVSYFLDKTPKYNLVVQEIFDLFPDAKFIILWRNPLAVVSSVMRTWHNGHWNLHHVDVEIYQGLANLIDAYRKEAHHVCAVQYEELVTSPEQAWQRIFDYLDLSFSADLLKNFSGVKFTGRFSDPNSRLARYQKITREPLHKWKPLLANPIRKAWCRRYLRWIGADRLKTMGYDLDCLLAELDAVPSSTRFLCSDLLMTLHSTVSRTIETRIMRHKLQALRSGQRIYMHK